MGLLLTVLYKDLIMSEIIYLINVITWIT